MNKREFQKVIDRCFNTRWQPEDFYAAYVWEHRKDLGSADYYSLSRRKQKAVRDIVNEIDPAALSGFSEAVIQEVNERMTYFIQEVCR